MKGFKEIVLQNWGIKLTAILLAFILWLAVHGDPGTERTITVPVEIHNLPRNIEITSGRPDIVEVTFRGSFRNIWFGQNPPVCVIDLSSTEEGERIIPLGPENLRLPRGLGLEVISVRPVRVHLILERTASKEVPIQPDVTGVPAKNFEIYEITYWPQTTTIKGPRSRVEKIKQVGTESIDIQDRRESGRYIVNLYIKDNLVHSTQRGEVEVSVEIGERRRRLTIKQVPVQLDDTSVTVSPARISINVLVPLSFKGNLTPSDFTATVSARKLDLTLPTVRVKPDVSFAHPMVPGIRVEEVQPAVVTVRKVDKS